MATRSLRTGHEHDTPLGGLKTSYLPRAEPQSGATMHEHKKTHHFLILLGAGPFNRVKTLLNDG